MAPRRLIRIRSVYKDLRALKQQTRAHMHALTRTHTHTHTHTHTNMKQVAVAEEMRF